jgi:hypothetical protein
MAHDEKNEAEIGDVVRIVETRPLSAQKRFKLDKVLERPTLRQNDKAVADVEPAVKPADDQEAES